VVAGAAYGRTDVEHALEEAGVPVTRVNVYAMIPSPVSGPKRDLAAEGIDAILLASPSAAEGFVNRAVFPPDARIITIGPTTSAAAAAVGLRVAAEARRPDLDGMLEALP
jgi:uroporphyrinogen-III synthase